MWIYVLSSDTDSSSTYVGSTGNLKARVLTHALGNERVRSSGGMRGWKVTVLERLPLGTPLREVFQREAWWIERLRPSMNRADKLREVQAEEDYLGSRTTTPTWVEFVRHGI